VLEVVMRKGRLAGFERVSVNTRSGMVCSLLHCTVGLDVGLLRLSLGCYK